MNYEKEFEIAMDLTKINSHKAKKLLSLIQRHVQVEDPFLKKECESNIRNFIFSTFMKSIDKNSRRELYDLFNNITYLSYEFEQDNPYWYVNSNGLTKYSFDDGVVTPMYKIPREYKKGFFLGEDNNTDEGISFMEKNAGRLLEISNYMDRKELLLTSGYKTIDNVPKAFTEKLIDYLGYSRISDNTKKRVK